VADFEVFWSDRCREYPCDYILVKKLGILGERLRQWNKSTFGDQNLKLIDIYNAITTLEDLKEVRPLFASEKSKL
jgi:hypothetical protein